MIVHLVSHQGDAPGFNDEEGPEGNIHEEGLFFIPAPDIRQDACHTVGCDIRREERGGGSGQEFIITPNEGFKISDVEVDGISVFDQLEEVPETENPDDRKYTFINVSAIHFIVAQFEKKVFTITSSAGSDGAVTTDETDLDPLYKKHSLILPEQSF